MKQLFESFDDLNILSLGLLERVQLIFHSYQVQLSR